MHKDKTQQEIHPRMVLSYSLQREESQERVAVKKMMQGRWLCVFHCHLGRQ